MEGKKEKGRKKGISRRTMLKGMAAAAGVAAGSGVITGFPMVWAQKLKDVKLLQLGPAYSTIAEVGKQASKDLGFEVEMQTADAANLLTRVMTQPKTLDVADLSFVHMPRVIPRARSPSTSRASTPAGSREMSPNPAATVTVEISSRSAP